MNAEGDDHHSIQGQAIRYVYRESSNPTLIKGEASPALYREKRSLMYTERGSQGKDLNTLTLLFHKRTSRVSTGHKRHIYLLILDY